MVSVRFRVQHFRSMRIRIRIQIRIQGDRVLMKKNLKVLHSLLFWRSVTFWYGSESVYPYSDYWILLLSSVTLRMPKKFIFFSYTLTLRHIIFSRLSSALKIKLVLKFFLQALFQSAQHLYEKRDGSGSVLQTNGSGSGRPKNMPILPDPDPQHCEEDSY
jgi:hypothetical protein